MKKRLAILLTLGMVAPSLAGCGGDAPAQDAQMILFSGLSAAAERAGLKNIKTGGRDITRRIFKEVSPWEW